MSDKKDDKKKEDGGGEESKGSQLLVLGISNNFNRFLFY